jgi:hypothetical protein
VRRAFGFVRDDVMKVTSNRQEPFVYGSLGGDDVPLVPAKAASVTPGPAPNEARLDYELALQIGNKAALNAFLAQHPDGFYASLAKLQLDKIAAEEARVAATEKARLTEQERARLVAEGAQKSQQAKAEADAKAAEQARIAAENAKRVAERQAAEAERKRATTDIASTGRTAAGAPTDDNAQGSAQGSAQASAQGNAQGDVQAKAQGDKGVNLAALSAGPTQADLVTSVQRELRRVGCFSGASDGDWNTASQRSMALFNKNAGTKFAVKLASTDALDAIKLKPSRVCPLVCDHGFKADGDRCSKIVCADGSFLNDDNECEKRRAKTPTAKRDDGDRQRVAPPRPEARLVPQAGQVMARPYQGRNSPGIGQNGQPLTGLQREQGCNGYDAIMSGKCP